MIDFLLKFTHATNMQGFRLNPFGFRPISRIVVLTGLLALLPDLARTQTAKTYRDGHKGTVTFPLGDLSFADEVVSFQMGDPHATPLYSDPSDALGPPNYDEKTDTKYTTLGCGGTLTLRFIDNVLIDVKGPQRPCNRGPCPTCRWGVEDIDAEIFYRTRLVKLEPV